MSEYWLLPVTLLTSTISGVTGFGGGTILIVAMSEFMGPRMLIPSHGVVQFSSNVSRVYFSRGSLRFDLIGRYGLGATVGAVLGAFFVLSIEESILWVVIGCYLALMTWAPKPKAAIRIPLKYEFIGLVSTFLSLFVGVTGPLLHPVMLRENLGKEEFIGSEAACCCITHGLKVISFMFISIRFLEYWPVILAMMACAVVGSYLGKRILNRISLVQFRALIKVVVTLMAVRMISKGVMG